MKNLMTTTALVLATALPVAAKDTTNDSVFMQYKEGSKTSADVLASDLIGMRVFTSENDIDAAHLSETDGDWNDIGEVSDVVMSREGTTESILLDIGGFLGVGEKTVAVNFDELNFVADDNDAGSYFLVFTANQEMLEEAQPFDFDQIGAWTSAAWNDAKATASETATDISASVSNAAEGVEQTAKDAMQATENAAAEAGNEIDRTAANLTAPDIKRDGFETYDVGMLTTEMLTGAPLYDINDEWIGEVSELIFDEQGKLKEAVLDVGGFLGIGEKHVVAKMDSLTIKRATDGDELRVYVDATKEQLEEMPTRDES